jgi:hypothetical protein
MQTTNEMDTCIEANENRAFASTRPMQWIHALKTELSLMLLGWTRRRSASV